MLPQNSILRINSLLFGMTGHDGIRFSLGRFLKADSPRSSRRLAFRISGSDRGNSSSCWQDRLDILVEVKMFPGLRNAGMSGSAARHGCQQGNRDHHEGRRAEHARA